MVSTPVDVIWNLPQSNFEEITIIPTNYSLKEDREYYNDTASSFYKFAKNKMAIGIYSDPEICLLQKSADWFGPVFYVGQLILENHEVLISLLDLISEYVKERFPNSTPNIKFEIVSKDKGDGIYKSVKYDGPSTNIKEVLKSFDKLD